MLTITDPATVPAPTAGSCSHAPRLFRPEALVEVEVVAAVAG